LLLAAALGPSIPRSFVAAVDPIFVYCWVLVCWEKERKRKRELNRNLELGVYQKRRIERERGREREREREFWSEEELLLYVHCEEGGKLLLLPLQGWCAMKRRANPSSSQQLSGGEIIMLDRSGGAKKGGCGVGSDFSPCISNGRWLLHFLPVIQQHLPSFFFCWCTSQDPPNVLLRTRVTES